MSRTRADRSLTDAASVNAAREEIVRALGPLAASPLDEPAVAEIQQVLGRVDSPVLRQALRKVSGRAGEPRPPQLTVPQLADVARSHANRRAPDRARSISSRPFASRAGSVAAVMPKRQALPLLIGGLV